MKVTSQQIAIRSLFNAPSPLASLEPAVTAEFGDDVTPLRLAVIGKSRSGHLCEIEVVHPRIWAMMPANCSTVIFCAGENC